MDIFNNSINSSKNSHLEAIQESCDSLKSRLIIHSDILSTHDISIKKLEENSASAISELKQQIAVLKDDIVNFKKIFREHYTRS